MMEEITKKHLELLRHTLGDKTCYRNHFLTGEGGDDFATMMELVERGLMTVRSAPEWVCGTHLFEATDAGKRAAWAGEEILQGGE